ncbi:serine/threonine protein kinase [Marinihelvus fidelis]|uniref:Serine/threonine protein kinase n=1 Tax=Marinihelvus fidelis TaxID=2613842 RepID=A0A5N0T681_9GAMM|nr:serine/threonine-protein kinase [Marinihelvus fidelis]KAA9130278.1 serine/threonine protein kinase [Marinihelvus fidelis]
MDIELWKKAEALFAQCADMQAAEQAAWLEAACDGDVELRALVDDLLAGDQIEDPVAPTLERAAADVGAGQESAWLGREIGAYTLTAKIAAGGMGVVFRGRRSDTAYDQEVAIKLLTSSLVTGELRRRLLVERQILADLNHPNICRLLDGGETDEGVPYLVMELIEGVPITEYCDREQLGLNARVELARQVCDAVQFAHRNLVVHRDIKPGNILVTKDGTPKLLDFGIAKLLDPVATAGGGHTTIEGFRLLSPRYASPEQVLGGPVTTASDTYSLGMLIYELLCGSDPFGRDETAATTGGRLPAPDFEHPARPSRRLAQLEHADEIATRRRQTVTGLARALKGDLETILMKALRAEPENRYATARELADDLDRFLDSRPVQARPPTAGYLVSRFWRRHRGASIAAVVAVLSLVAGAGVATYGFVEAKRAERIAEEEARSAEAVAGFLVDLFDEANPNVSAGEPRSVHELLDIGAAKVAEELADSPMAQIAVLESLSSAYKSMDDLDAATGLFERMLALRREHSPDDVEPQVVILSQLGDIARMNEDLATARDYLGQALALHEARIGEPTESLSDTTNNLALVLEHSGEHDEAMAMMKQSLAIRRALYEAPHGKISTGLHNVGWLLSRNGDLAEAEQYLQDAIDMRVQVYGEIHPRVGVTTMVLSRVQSLRGNLEGAAASAQKAHDIATTVYPDSHVEIALTLYEVGVAREKAGELVEANRIYREVADMDRERDGPVTNDLAFSLKAVGRTWIDLARYPEAQAALAESMDIFAQLQQDTVRSRFDADNQYARLLVRSGEPAAALEHLGPVGTGDDVVTPGARMWVERNIVRAEALVALEQLAEASRVMIETLAAIEDRPAERRERYPEALHQAAKVELASGDAVAAQATLLNALEQYALKWDDDYWPAALARADLARAACQRGDAARSSRELDIAVPALRAALGEDHPQTRFWSAEYFCPAASVAAELAEERAGVR